MNYRSILLIVFVVFFSYQTRCSEPTQKLTTHDIASHAQFWASQYLSDLNQEEITLLMNLFYFNGRLLDDQIKVGNAILFAYVHAGMINSLITVNEEDAQKVAMASAVALRKLKEEYLPARKNSEQILRYCIQEFKKPAFSKLDRIINEFNAYGQAIVSQFTKQDVQSITQIIEECRTTFSQHLPHIQQCNTILGDILDHKNPYVKDDTSPDLANLNAAIYTSENSIKILSDMISQAIRIKRMMFDIMNITKIINHTFYQNSLVVLEHAKLTPVLIMFDENGIIAPEDRWQDLPDLVQNK